MAVTVCSPPLRRITPPSAAQNISDLPNWQHFHNCLPVMDGCYLVINTLPSKTRVTQAQCAQSASLPSVLKLKHQTVSKFGHDNKSILQASASHSNEPHHHKSKTIQPTKSFRYTTIKLVPVLAFSILFVYSSYFSLSHSVFSA